MNVYLEGEVIFSILRARSYQETQTLENVLEHWNRAVLFDLQVLNRSKKGKCVAIWAIWLHL